MLDSNWELINGPDAHHIEALNAANTINVLEALITFLLHHQSAVIPNERALCELHRAGTLFLLSEPGQYRTIPVHVADGAGNVFHDPPPCEKVQGYMDDFFQQIARIWAEGDALDVAAYALWRINWVHPFRNGNGRTARAYAYACLCGHLGVILPGSPTVIDQIMTNRDEYERVIRVADACVKDGRDPDLSPMKDFLDSLLQVQMANA
jgi:Fic family protein